MRYACIFSALFFACGVSALAQRVIEIDLTNQRLYLVQQGRVVLNAPISSGRPGHETPAGIFQVTDKDVNHASSFYGFFGNPVTRQIVVADADVDMKTPPGLEFVRAPMRYYIQFQPAIGLHAGFLPGYPASHGCVRVPEEYAIPLFQAVSIGTPVRVYGPRKAQLELQREGFERAKDELAIRRDAAKDQLKRQWEED